MCISLHVNPSSEPVRDAVFQSAADGASVIQEGEWRAIKVRYLRFGFVHRRAKTGRSVFRVELRDFNLGAASERL